MRAFSINLGGRGKIHPELNGPLKEASGNTGFSLVEMLIVLAIFSLMMGILFSSIQHNSKVAEFSIEEAELQQVMQDILNLMTEELKQAGYPSAGYYDAIYLAQPGAERNLVSHGLLEIQPHSLKFDGDVNPSDHPTDNGRINYVSYYLSGSSPPYILNRIYGEIAADGSLPASRPQKISEQVESLDFRYFDRSGNETTQLDHVSTIQINISLRTLKRDPFSNTPRTISETVRVGPLNLL
jgi:prepilin-type N-terminal cleavage/methylation domain-containing protein